MICLGPILTLFHHALHSNGKMNACTNSNGIATNNTPHTHWGSQMDWIEIFHSSMIYLKWENWLPPKKLTLPPDRSHHVRNSTVNAMFLCGGFSRGMRFLQTQVRLCPLHLDLLMMQIFSAQFYPADHAQVEYGLLVQYIANDVRSSWKFR